MSVTKLHYEEEQKMKKVMLVVALLILITVGFSGCINFDSTQSGPEVISYFEDEYDANENSILSVSTVNGLISITSWDGEKIALNATKRTRYGEDDLKNAEIVVSVNGDEINIDIQHSTPIRSRAVDLVIKIPNNVTVKFVSSTNGGIIVENVKGIVEAITTNGGIEIKGTTGIGNLFSTNGGISAELFDIKEDIDIVNTNGGVTLFINPLINASIQISTTNGGITVDGEFITETESTFNSFSGILGNGGFSINIITTNGGIKIEELEV
jgi:hypothetical protein